MRLTPSVSPQPTVDFGISNQVTETTIRSLPTEYSNRIEDEPFVDTFTDCEWLDVEDLNQSLEGRQFS